MGLLHLGRVQLTLQNHSETEPMDVTNVASDISTISATLASLLVAVLTIVASNLSDARRAQRGTAARARTRAFREVLIPEDITAVIQVIVGIGRRIDTLGRTISFSIILILLNLVLTGLGVSSYSLPVSSDQLFSLFAGDLILTAIAVIVLTIRGLRQ